MISARTRSRSELFARKRPTVVGVMVAMVGNAHIAGTVMAGTAMAPCTGPAYMLRAVALQRNSVAGRLPHGPPGAFFCDPAHLRLDPLSAAGGTDTRSTHGVANRGRPAATGR